MHVYAETQDKEVVVNVMMTSASAGDYKDGCTTISIFFSNNGMHESFDLVCPPETEVRIIQEDKR